MEGFQQKVSENYDQAYVSALVPGTIIGMIYQTEATVHGLPCCSIRQYLITLVTLFTGIEDLFYLTSE